MKGEWCYFNKYLTGDQCNQIIEDALTLPPQPATIGVGGPNVEVDTSFRRSTVRFINEDDQRFSYLFDILWKTAISANQQFFDFHITRLPYLQFAEYSEENRGEYREHHDVFWMNGDPDHHRKLSAIIQLSDPNSYTGCDLEITEASYPLPADIVRETGTIIFFPSLLRHRATPIITGKRYSIAAWFEGRKWS